MLYVVRHAKAGSRTKWVGDDRERPLTDAGLSGARTRRASGAAGHRPARQQPVPALRADAGTAGRGARHHRRPTSDWPRTSGSSARLALLAEVPDGSVLCSHGDVIPDTMGALERRGCRFAGEPDWRKASVWVLGRDASGAITHAAAWPPPDV